MGPLAEPIVPRGGSARPRYPLQPPSHFFFPRYSKSQWLTVSRRCCVFSALTRHPWWCVRRAFFAQRVRGNRINSSVRSLSVISMLTLSAALRFPPRPCLPPPRVVAIRFFFWAGLRLRAARSGVVLARCLWVIKGGGAWEVARAWGISVVLGRGDCCLSR